MVAHKKGNKKATANWNYYWCRLCRWPSASPVQTKSILHSVEQTTRDIDLHVNPDKTKFMCFNQDGAISSLNGKFLKPLDQFIYLSVYIYIYIYMILMGGGGNREGAFSIIIDGPLKLINNCTYLGKRILSTENDINMRLAKTWITIDHMDIWSIR